MIHPDAEIVDLAAQRWGELCELMARQKVERRWAYVLHRGGQVLSTDPDRLESVAVGDGVDDPATLAGKVRAETGFERAVVIDEAHLDSLVREAADHARPGRTLQEYRSDVEQTYWASPGVVTDPAPPRSPWAAVRSYVRQRGDRLRAVFVADGLTIELLLADGLVTRVTCPPLTAAQVEEADAHLRITWSDLGAVVSSPDPFTAMADLLDRTRDQHGLVGLGDVLRGG